MQIRVMIADDHPIVRSGIRNELNRYPDLTVVGEAEDGDETLQKVAELRPDVLLLDINMPGLRAVQVLRALRGAPVPPKVVILTAYSDPENVVGLLQAGASGYITKEARPDEIGEAIRAAARGGILVSPAIMNILTEIGVHPKAQIGKEILSRREMEVLEYLARGISNQQIADEIGLSERTVRFHVENILTKLGVHNRMEAVMLAIQNGWIKP